jgi:hypothetical protein
MTRTEALLDIVRRQRHFEWQLARDEQQRAAGLLVAGKTHDLLNLVQIVNLASLELARRSEPSAREFLDDLLRAAEDAKVSLRQLMEISRPEPQIIRTAVAPAVAAAIESLREIATPNLQLAIKPDTVTRCTCEEMEHLVIGLVLDVIDLGHDIDLTIRERQIDGRRWVELMRGTAVIPAGERFELRVVEAIAHRGGGELVLSDRRGGGIEVVVALPVA